MWSDRAGALQLPAGAESVPHPGCGGQQRGTGDDQWQAHQWVGYKWVGHKWVDAKEKKKSWRENE